MIRESIIVETSGTTAATFSPNATCTRGQIVTFLYRAFADSTALANKDEHEGMICDPVFGWMTQTDYNNMISVQEGGH